MGSKLIILFFVFSIISTVLGKDIIPKEGNNFMKLFTPSSISFVYTMLYTYIEWSQVTVSMLFLAKINGSSLGWLEMSIKPIS